MAKERKSGAELIAIEREEQTGKHWRTVAHDCAHNPNGELLDAAMGLIHHKYSYFPSSWDEAAVNKMMAKNDVERLVIAGALIAAEIDRLQY